jgi:hypothetical protein
MNTFTGIVVHRWNAQHPKTYEVFRGFRTREEARDYARKHFGPHPYTSSSIWRTK